MIRTKSDNRQSIGGFTIVEVMVAMIIFAIVIASGMACLKMGMTMVDNSRHHTRVAQIMQSEIERIRSMPWATFDALGESEQSIALDDQFSSDNYSTYKVTRLISAGTGDSKKITLTTSWTDINGVTKSRIYVTHYTKGGLYDYIY